MSIKCAACVHLCMCMCILCACVWGGSPGGCDGMACPRPWRTHMLRYPGTWPILVNDLDMTVRHAASNTTWVSPCEVCAEGEPDGFNNVERVRHMRPCVHAYMHICMDVMCVCVCVRVLGGGAGRLQQCGEGETYACMHGRTVRVRVCVGRGGVGLAPGEVVCAVGGPDGRVTTPSGYVPAPLFHLLR